MDENFDGRISYTELKDHIIHLGFKVDGEDNNQLALIPGSHKKKQDRQFIWRDKTIELVIKILHKRLGSKPIWDYLK